ncbi:MAG: transglutaminase domain-containing protein [Planctomycetaceae bacterium]|nr:transglutaminase domain-containing protein [Planctomycetaceae bacterium]
MQVFLQQRLSSLFVVSLSWLSLLCLLAGFTACSQSPAVESGKKTAGTGTEVKEGEDWQVIYIEDQKVGYARNQTRVENRSGKKVVQKQNDFYLKYKRFGQTLNMAVHLQTEESVQGELLSYEFEMQNPPAGSTVSKGVVQDGQLKIETNIANQTAETKLEWKPDDHPPTYIDRVFRESPMQPGEKKSFSMLLAEFSKITEVNLKAIDYESVEIPGRTGVKCLHVEMQQSLIPGLTTDLYVNEEGELVKSSTDFLGAKMYVYLANKTEALKELSGKGLDLAMQALIPVSPISRAHETEQVVYEIGMEKDDPSKYVVAGDTQQVKKLDANQIELTVTKAPVPEVFPEAKIDAEFMKPTQFLQSADAGVIKHANAAVGSETNPWKQALLMEKYVHRNLKKKNFSTALASAAEVARNMEGDCTEHAMLLAAMLRAQKLPSRVAVGLVYIPTQKSFCGHMWTEVFLDNHWIPLDATLGKGGIGAGHIKLRDSSLAENEPAPLTLFLPVIQSVGKLKISVLDYRPRAQ